MTAVMIGKDFKGNCRGGSGLENKVKRTEVRIVSNLTENRT